MTSVLVIAFDGEVNPSTRLRILQYIPSLERQGFSFERFFVPYGGSPDARRLMRLGRESDVIFVQRVLSRTVLRVLRRLDKPVVFDIDDGLHYIRQSQYARARSPRNIRDHILVRYRTLARGGPYFSSRKRPLERMLELASAVIVGNEWLHNDLELGARAIVLPTAVWLDGVPAKQHEPHTPVVLGWIGVRSNLFHLELLHEAFRNLHSQYGEHLELVIVSNSPIRVPVLKTRFVQWNLETESETVLRFDIGLMPLQDDPFSRAKCAFKAIFCMSRGVPVVASPVGANASLITSGENGYLAASTEEWVASLATLADDASLRSQLGQRARATIEREFSADLVARRLRRVLTDASASVA